MIQGVDSSSEGNFDSFKRFKTKAKNGNHPRQRGMEWDTHWEGNILEGPKKINFHDVYLTVSHNHFRERERESAEGIIINFESTFILTCCMLLRPSPGPVYNGDMSGVIDDSSSYDHDESKAIRLGSSYTWKISLIDGSDSVTGFTSGNNIYKLWHVML